MTKGLNLQIQNTGKIYGFCLFLTLAYLFKQTSTGAQSLSTDIDSLLSISYEQHNFSGTFLLAIGDEVLFHKQYGLADFINKKPFTLSSTFQIASVSKQFTAFGIMLLHKNRSLSYNDAVSKYIDSFPYPTITIHNLLNHTSGLPDFWNDIRPNLDHTIANGNRELIEYLNENKLPLTSEPGERFAYADINYVLLASIIEKVSGLTYEEFMGKYIFTPARMYQTKALSVTDIRNIKEQSIAKGHTYQPEKNEYAYAHELPDKDFVFYLGNFYGDGSVISSARDLFTWSRALMSYQLLDSISMADAFLPARDKNGNILIANPSSPLKPTYGFGWSLATHPALGKIYYHSGGHPGFTSYFLISPEREITFVFLCNFDYNAGVGQVRSILLEEIAKALTK